MSNVLAWTGYWVGLGVEIGVIVIFGVLLALILTGVLFKWIAAIKASSEQRKEERARKKAEREAREAAEAEARAAAEAEAEAAAAEAEAEEIYEDEEEATEEEAETGEVEEEAEEEEATEEEEQPAEEAVEEEAVEEEVVEEKPKKKKKKGKKHDEEEEEAEEEAAATEAETTNGATEVVYVNEGIVFNESKTITELYEELSAEQKSYFDELREEALTKPDAELSMARNFVAVKIGKRNLIKLLIKRGVTNAEFVVENEQLKQLRLSSTNKRGKSTIKVKPTVVQVLDLQSLKVAIDMLNLAYEELILD